MTDPILHHYDRSPYSELLRLALGIKGAAWKSVIIPDIAPKPELTPLTGGYRKTPVLQIGADIYCDTTVAIEAIEALPGPTLFPAPLGRLGALVALQAGGPTFMNAILSAIVPFVDSADPAFLADRQQLFGGDIRLMKRQASQLLVQFTGWLAKLEDALSDGRDFLGGGAPGYADCAAAMNVWFQGQVRLKEARLAAFPIVAAWFARVDAIGHGTRSDITAQDALDVALASNPLVVENLVEDSDFQIGQRVVVRTEDPGADAVEGVLARLTAREVILLRDDRRVGQVAVHFPRIGQIVKANEPA